MGQSSVNGSRDGIISRSISSVSILIGIEGKGEAVLNVLCQQSLKTFGDHQCSLDRPVLIKAVDS